MGSQAHGANAILQQLPLSAEIPCGPGSEHVLASASVVPGPGPARPLPNGHPGNAQPCAAFEPSLAAPDQGRVVPTWSTLTTLW